MVDGQMLKDLPNDVMTNILSFSLGTPQQLKLHNNKALRKIQNKYKFDIEELKEEKRRSYVEDNLTIERYGFKIEDKDYEMNQAFNIVKNQKENAKKRLRIGKGLTKLNIYVRILSVGGKEFVKDICLPEVAFTIYFLEDRLESMDRYFNRLEGYDRPYSFIEAEIVFTRKVYDD